MKKFILISAFCFQLSAFSQNDPIRISGDIANPVTYGAIADSNAWPAGYSAYFVRGDYVTFEFSPFYAGSFLSNVSQFSYITLQLFASQNTTNAPLLAQSITNGQPGWNGYCRPGDWATGASGSTNQNVLFTFADTNTSFDLSGQNQMSFWLRISGMTTNSRPRPITMLEGSLAIYDGPISPIYLAPGWPLGIYVDAAGNLLTPSNFFTVNSNLLNASVGPAVLPAGVITNGQTNPAFNNGITITAVGPFGGSGPVDVLTVNATSGNITPTLIYFLQSGQWTEEINGGGGITRDYANPSLIGRDTLDTNGDYTVTGNIASPSNIAAASITLGTNAPITNWPSAAGGGSQTPWTSTINAASNSLTNLAAIGGSFAYSLTNVVIDTGVGNHFFDSDSTLGAGGAVLTRLGGSVVVTNGASAYDGTGNNGNGFFFYFTPKFTNRIPSVQINISAPHGYGTGFAGSGYTVAVDDVETNFFHCYINDPFLYDPVAAGEVCAFSFWVHDGQ